MTDLRDLVGVIADLKELFAYGQIDRDEYVKKLKELL